MLIDDIRIAIIRISIVIDLWLIISLIYRNIRLHIKYQPQSQQKTHFLKPKGWVCYGSGIEGFCHFSSILIQFLLV